MRIKSEVRSRKREIITKLIRMRDYSNDNRTVLSLDAGGTNLVFNAVRGNKEIIDPVIYSTPHDSLESMLLTIIKGFKDVLNQTDGKAVAISFAFPGPAEYEKGIIGDLVNLPVFRGGVALGPMLEEQFNIPVFINNDGDLFAYGEAIAGLLPYINSLLEKGGNPKRFRNLFGATFGTGFGGGIISNGNLFTGDNSAQAEINRMRNKLYPDKSVEESVSIRGVERVYHGIAGNDSFELTPKEIYDIALDNKPGNREAAVRSFKELSEVAGDALADAVTLVDGLVVLGGGLAKAHSIFLQNLVDEMNHKFTTFHGEKLDRMEVTAFNLEDESQLERFLKGEAREITIPFTDKGLPYDPMKRIGIGITKLGTSRAVSIGAYAYALNQLDSE